MPGARFIYLADDSFSHQLYQSRGHELLELAWCERWLAGTEGGIVDCGANIGWFSAVLAQRLPNVECVAVEGNSVVARRCEDVITKLQLTSKVKVLNLVLSAGDHDDFVVPHLDGKEAWQTAKQRSELDAAVPNRSLDTLLSELRFSPSLIKLDCEGFEPRILRGATRTLAARSCAWMIECNDDALYQWGSNRGELFGRLRDSGYECYHLASFGRKEPFGVVVDTGFPSTAFNFAAIPVNGPLAARWKFTKKQIRAERS